VFAPLPLSSVRLSPLRLVPARRSAVRLSAALVLFALDACHSATPEPAPQRPLATSAATTPAPATSAATAPVVAPPPTPRTPAPVVPTEERDFHYAASTRLVAIGDLHGDLSAARAALRLGGAIDADDHWAGGPLTVVQTGDQIDRGDDDRDILDLFERLKEEARAAGGRVVALNGNHEVMNVQGDYRYVTPAAVSAFAGVSPRSALARSAPAALAERAAAFLPGGGYALKLAQRDVIAMVGDSVFVHGGVLPEHVRYGIARLNRETRDWMQGGVAAAPAALASERAPIWARDYSEEPLPPESCAALGEVLGALGAKRMVVGHTTQKTGISSACGERVYRIDVGMSRYFGGPIQVLEIAAGKVRVLKGAR
jgi:hypothetical protein